MTRPTTTSLPVLSLDRRGFCSLAAKCALLAAAACDGNDGDPSDPDASTGGSPDAAPPPDGAFDGGPQADAPPLAGACSAPEGHDDVGPPSLFVLGEATFFEKVNYFVMRDEAGLYAMAALCRHQGSRLQKVAGMFHCHLHLSNFTLNGAVINGPAVLPLAHYELCVLPNGNLGVKKTSLVDPSTRLVI